MAFVVESGVGDPLATSYLAVTAADTYHEDLGNTTWAAALTADKETALVRATRSLDSLYSGQWRGEKFSYAQALDWPRSYAYTYPEEFELTGVPVILKNVTAEAALIELATPGALLASRDRGGAVKSEKVDIITMEYFEGASSATVYPTIAAMISPLVMGGRGSLSVLRC